MILSKMRNLIVIFPASFKQSVTKEILDNKTLHFLFSMKKNYFLHLQLSTLQKEEKKQQHQYSSNFSILLCDRLKKILLPHWSVQEHTGMEKQEKRYFDH